MRRRFSRDWHEEVVATLDARSAAVLQGHSNVLSGAQLGLVPIGTMAHEYLQTFQALGVRLRDFQKAALEDWVQEYRGDLGIALTDVVGMDAFLADFDLYFAKLFDGLRHDSGDRSSGARRRWRTTPSCASTRTPSAWCSPTAWTCRARSRCTAHFADRMQCGFGIGTNLSNDVGLTPLNIVMKLVACNGQPVAKLSDIPGKTLCKDETFLAYLRQVFHTRSRDDHDLKLAVAQLNSTVGDIAGNVAAMSTPRAGAAAGRPGGVLRAVADRLLPGGPAGGRGFLRARATAHSRSSARGLARIPDAALGGRRCPRRTRGPGKRCTTRCCVLRDGDVLLEYSKQLLPTYNIFDERRHFEPGPDVARVLRIGDTQVGLHDLRGRLERRGPDYRVNPFERLRDAAPDLVVSINASPSNIGKREQRHQMFGAASRARLPILYVNQVGGHDQLVFDGARSRSSRSGRGVRGAALRRGRTTLVSTAAASPRRRPAVARPLAEGLPTLDFYRRQIVLGLHDYARRCGFTQAVVGSSGGIDSALTLALAVEALGPETSSPSPCRRAFRAVGQRLGSSAVPQPRHPLAHPSDRRLVEQLRAAFEAAFGRELRGLALENLQARIRGTILMEYSNSFGHLLLTTGNKTEISVGYCTLYGDTNGGLGLLGDLYKTEVFALSRHLNEAPGRELIPQAIIDKPPSAELAPGQKDTDSLPPYAVLDEMLKVLIEGRRLASRGVRHARPVESSGRRDGRR